MTPSANVPPLPPAAALPVPLDLGVTAARPFSLARIGTADRARAAQCLTAAIYYEAASEPDDGQRAVAQVVLNRVRHPAFPGTVCGVVYQGSERVGCQFSFACDGAMARMPSRGGWARAARAAAAALGGYVYAPVGLATHYHTYAVTPAWNRSLVMTDAVGAHFFHRWKGWWGTAAAFRQPYAGGEPVPGPHAPSAAGPMAGLITLPTTSNRQVAGIAAPTMPLTPAATIRPAYADSGRLREEPATAVEDPLPDSGRILDKWRDSGTPLR